MSQREAYLNVLQKLIDADHTRYEDMTNQMRQHVATLYIRQCDPSDAAHHISNAAINLDDNESAVAALFDDEKAFAVMIKKALPEELDARFSRGGAFYRSPIQRDIDEIMDRARIAEDREHGHRGNVGDDDEERRLDSIHRAQDANAVGGAL